MDTKNNIQEEYLYRLENLLDNMIADVTTLLDNLEIISKEIEDSDDVKDKINSYQSVHDYVISAGHKLVADQNCIKVILYQYLAMF